MHTPKNIVFASSWCYNEQINKGCILIELTFLIGLVIGFGIGVLLVGVFGYFYIKRKIASITATLALSAKDLAIDQFKKLPKSPAYWTNRASELQNAFKNTKV